MPAPTEPIPEPDPISSGETQSLEDGPGAAAPGSDPPTQRLGAPASISSRLANPSARRLEPIPLQPNDGQIKSRYELVQELARGGMGIVYRGFDRELERELAVKALLLQHLDEPDYVRRFFEEAWISGQLQHPGVVPVYDLGRTAEGRPFFAMKLVEGRTLSALLAARKSPADDLARFLQIFEQVCQTLAYAHARGVIHRDVKPSNIMVGSFGEVQVMDWGLASVLDAASLPPLPADQAKLRLAVHADTTIAVSGEVIGTPAYMAPEQARGEQDLDERCDVFGLGAILFEILTGLPPYASADAREAYEQALVGNLADAVRRLNQCEADRELKDLVCDCLAVERGKRPRDAKVVAERMRSYLTGVAERLRQAELAKATAQARTAEVQKRQRLTVALALSIIALVVLASVGWQWISRQRAARAEERAKAAQDKAQRDSDTLRRIHKALEEATTLREQAKSDAPGQVLKWSQALAAARTAQELFSSDLAMPELQTQIQQLVEELTQAEHQARQVSRQRRMQNRLQEIRLAKTAVKGGVFDTSRADPEYAAVFQELGIDFDKSTPAEVAQRLRQEALGEDLAAAMVDWAAARWFAFGLKDPLARKLMTAALAGTSDIWRASFWKALADGDPSAIRKLAAQPNVASQPPSTIAILADQLMALGDLPLAAKILQAALQKYPADFWLNHQIGYMYTLMQPPRLDASLRYYGVAMALRPQSPGVRVNLGMALLRKSAYAEAEAEFREAIRLKPDYGGAYVDLGSVYEQQKKYDEALKHYQKAVEVEPKLEQAHEALARVFSLKGQRPQAIAEINQAVALQPNVGRLHVLLGEEFFHQGKATEAQEEFRRGFQLDPQEGGLRFLVGTLFLEAGQNQQAVPLLREAVILTPAHPESHCNLAHALRRLKRYAEALPEMRRGHQLGLQQADWPYPSAAWVNELEDLIKLDARLTVIQAGQDKPFGLDETLRLAMFCLTEKGQNCAAYQFFQRAFQMAPGLLDNANVNYRYLAAATAFASGTGMGADAASLSLEEKEKMRAQALEWMQAEFTSLQKRFQAGKRDEVRNLLENWFRDSAWRVIPQLPAAEGTAWQKLWSDANNLLNQAREKK
jgi:eukaryotic-like serine/threonine-protein kinase